MKPHGKTIGKITSPDNHQDVKTANPKECQKKALRAVTTYEDDDLRRIVAKAQTEATDPYRALLESGVIKNAAEFFERGNG